MEEEKMYNILDDRHEIFNMYKSQCARCRFFTRDGYRCQAFPEGIPEEILLGDQNHEKTYNGQKGNTLFSPKF